MSHDRAIFAPRRGAPALVVCGRCERTAPVVERIVLGARLPGRDEYGQVQYERRVEQALPKRWAEHEGTPLCPACVKRVMPIHCAACDGSFVVDDPAAIAACEEIHEPGVCCHVGYSKVSGPEGQDASSSPA